MEELCFNWYGGRISPPDDAVYSVARRTNWAQSTNFTDLELVTRASSRDELQLPELLVNQTSLSVVTPHAASCKYLHQLNLHSADLFISRGAVCVSCDRGWMMSGRLAGWKHFICFLILALRPRFVRFCALICALCVQGPNGLLLLLRWWPFWLFGAVRKVRYHQSKTTQLIKGWLISRLAVFL